MPYTPFANQEYRNFFHAYLEVPTVLRSMRVANHMRVLEVGCGRGVALVRLAELRRPTRLAGLDIAPELIDVAGQRARRAGASLELHVGDVRAMPFEDGAFDVVMDFGTCYHIDRPEAALREIARVLTHDGLFVHESPLAQRIAHPVRTSGRSLPWEAAPELQPHRHALLWDARRKIRPS